MTIMDMFMLELSPDFVLSKPTDHVQFKHSFNPWYSHLFSISHLPKKVFDSVLAPNFIHDCVKCRQEDHDFFHCQSLPRFDIHRDYSVTSNPILIPFNQVLTGLLMILNLQHALPLVSLHFHLLALSSSISSFFIHCFLPVFDCGFMIRHKVFLVVIQFSFETDFLSYLYHFHSQIRIFMFLSFINHGFQINVVLIVAFEVWDHSLLRRYSALAVDAGRTRIKLVDVLWSDILERIRFGRVYKLGTYLYGSIYRWDEGQVQLARIEQP